MKRREIDEADAAVSSVIPPQGAAGGWRWPVLLLVAALAAGTARGEQGGATVTGDDDRSGSAARSDARPIGPPDVFALVARVQAEVELIRIEMGRPKDVRSPVAVSGAAPREVYFQGRTLFTKANRLALELTREQGAPPELPGNELTPAHVHAVVTAALRQIERCKDELGISGESVAPSRDPQKTPTDVFRAIVQVNRQLNGLLDRRFSPADVYQQVTLAISYASKLLATFPGATRIPPAPALQRGKRPTDVHRRLAGCFERVGEIAERSGVKMLTLEVSAGEQAATGPDDVYDIATLLVSELAHLHARRAGTKPPIVPYYPGRKFPSHVHQRAGILEAQLIELQRRVEADPRWLQGNGAAASSSSR